MFLSPLFVSLSLFREVAEEAVNAIVTEMQQKADIPILVKLSMKPRLVDEEMGPLGDSSTMYRDTFGYAAANILKNNSSSSVNLSKTYPKTSTDNLTASIHMDPSTTILSAGTALGTMQLPGYTGHIPANKRNARKVEHSFGLVPRPFHNNLLLSQERVGCMAGYTGISYGLPNDPRRFDINFMILGYVSKNAPEFRERVTSTDPRTTNGAAFGPIRRML